MDFTDAQQAAQQSQQAVGQAQQVAQQAQAWTDGAKGAWDTAKEIVDLFFGSDSDKQVEGKQTTPDTPARQNPEVPFGVPAPTVPPELASRVQGATMLATTLQPVLQVLSSVVGMMDGNAARSLMDAAQRVGAQAKGPLKAQVEGAQAAVQRVLQDASAKLGRPITGPEQLSREEMDKVLGLPAPAVPGLTNPPPDGDTPTLQGTLGELVDKLGKVLPVMPVVVPPDASGGQAGVNPWLEMTPEPIKQSGFPAGTFSAERPRILFKADPVGLVTDPARLRDPDVCLANTAKLATMGKALAAQYANAADSADLLGDAANALGDGRARQALYLSLLVLLRSLVQYNLNADADLSPTALTATFLRDWARQAPPTTALGTALAAPSHEEVRHLVRGVDAPGEDVTAVLRVRYQGQDYDLASGSFMLHAGRVVFFNEALIPAGATYAATVRHTRAIDAALATVAATQDLLARPDALGAVPGTLVYAAYGDQVPRDTLGRLLSDIPSGVARRLGLHAAPSEIRQIITDLTQNDQRVSEIPGLLMGLAPVLRDAHHGLVTFLALLTWVRAQSSLYAELRPYETMVSTNSLRFVQLVQATTWGPAQHQATLAGHLDVAEQATLVALARAWDAMIGSLAANQEQYHVGVVDAFLARARDGGIPADWTMEHAVTVYPDEVQAAYSTLGADLVQATAAAGTLWRALVVLNSAAIPEPEAARRVMALLQQAGTFYDAVTHLPNKGCLGRIAEVLA